ncbi:hypothetical protein BDV12DRAFT_30576 [Aspergillus spectabilis]
MSLYQTLLYILSLSSVALAGDQDVLRNSGLDAISSSLYISHAASSNISDLNSHHDASTSSIYNTPTTENLSCAPNEKQCNNACIPSTHDCCSAAEHCYPGDYCFQHGGEIRCCPEGLACFQISGDVCFEQTVLWYEAVIIVKEDEDGDEVVTLWDLQEEMRETSTRVTVTASYPGEGRELFQKVSEGVVKAEATTVAWRGDRDVAGTRTSMVVKPTARAGLFGGLSGGEQIVFG